ncbi:MAG: enoyL-CoA [Prolixibacteraceae bacterium]|mgnify:CR=1 FL=1|nr:MAG: enoyL-CoA [Prolixibacteraceae bacterium]
MVLKFSINLKFRVKNQIVYAELQNTLINSFTFGIQKNEIMARRIINNYQEFEALHGQVIGVSDYITITQEQINMFAEATLDFQWIHTNPERAASESPFKTTIAHGYLTVSMLTYLWYNVVDVRNVKMIVNYGIENLRFQQPVLVNDKIRATVSLHEIKNLRGIAKIQVKIVVDIEGQKKPAYEALITFLYHFE